MANHKIKIVARKSGAKIAFDPEPGLWRDDNGKKKFVFSKNEHQMKKGDKHDLEFHIVSNDGLDLEFVEKPRDAMWVIPAPNGNECPDQTDFMDYSAICPTDVQTNKAGKRTILKVTNSNMEEKDWAFAMNFVRGRDATSKPGKSERWDPIVKNTNGGAEGTIQSIAVIAGCLLVGAVLITGALWLTD
jgi:hypothetical protein